MTFVHLHTHSHYSLLGALPKIPDLVATAVKDGMKALALTDNGNLYGAIEFYKECERQGIKPILGIDAYVANRSRLDKQTGVDNIRTRLLLLARDETGYKNLIQLATKGHLEGFYYKPRIDKALIEMHASGLICIASSESDLARAIEHRDIEKAKNLADWYRSVFGSDMFYLEIIKRPETDSDGERLKRLVSFAKDSEVPLVAAHDIFYVNPEDRPAWETLLSVQSGGERERRSFGERAENFSFLSQKEMNERFKDLPEALAASTEIAAACNLKLQFGSWVFPNFRVESGLSHDEELRRLVYEGLSRHKIEKTAETEGRIEYELKIIRDKGYSPYFLVVADLLRYAHQNGILTNIRGSVAGSMVTYLCGITNINPIEYALPFERFLNPERPSAPDIDMDFADNRRDEMIDYAREKYGADKVAQIGTFGTMLARGVVRDVARAMGHPYAVGDRIARLIPFGSQGFPMTISRAFEIVPDLKELYKKDAEVKGVIDMAKKIEGCARHISVHAAGVVIAPESLVNFVPLQFDPKGEGKIITQYDMYSVEDAGLLKFDFLGLKNLSIIADTVDRIRAIEEKETDPETIPLDDKKTFAILAKGETEGLFQLNGEAMTRFLMELKPTTIHDINAMVALYRPGPMQFIPQFIKRKHNPKLASYLDPALEPILSRTYGVLVYQDDLLIIAKDIAGYSWLEVDKFRKAVGKKIPEEMAAQKEKFIQGCVSHSGWSEKKARELWSWVEPFAAYGFNKAHAASYGRIAYQTAYFKANYPAIYMSAVLTADSGNVEEIGALIHECKRMGIPVLPPLVNESFRGFSVVRAAGKPDTIRFGLATIKNLGEGVAQQIVRERKEHGKYTSLAHFLDRVKDRNLNKKSLEALIKSGALDDFGERGAMFASLDLLLSYHKEQMKQGGSHESLFTSVGAAAPEISLPPVPPAEREQKLAWEKELLGLYVSGHPLERFQEKMARFKDNSQTIKERREGEHIALAGIIEEFREIITKQNQKMTFMKLADFLGNLEVVIFPRLFEECKTLIKPEQCLAMSGTVSRRNGGVSLIAEKIRAL
ncbi:DNA polymerase III subunit alpha [Patescibacteria group bacterium]|nr:MAG: DNA polymerase III subunit alpha [Patescibacteria group bacterium]